MSGFDPRTDRHAAAPGDINDAAPGPQAYGTIVVVGGGCYGSYYVRQLGRARAAGALSWREVVVVDRDPGCRVARALADNTLGVGEVRVAIAGWGSFFGDYLTSACKRPEATTADAIVPSPLMPHLMSEWLHVRARALWPDRLVGIRPIESIPGIPWQRGAPDGTRYVSFAEWVCPVNCIEPATCPKTRGPRWWTMPEAIESYVASARAAGDMLAGPVIFHCTHRAYGVGMFDTASAVRAERLVQDCVRAGATAVLVGTVSHCHGALNVLTIMDGE